MSPLETFYNSRSESFPDEKRNLFFCLCYLPVSGLNRQPPTGRRSDGLGTEEQHKQISSEGMENS